MKDIYYLKEAITVLKIALHNEKCDDASSIIKENFSRHDEYQQYLDTLTKSEWNEFCENARYIYNSLRG